MFSRIPDTQRNRRRLDSRGAVAVEFALILPVLILFLYTLVEVGRGVWTHNVLQLAVEEAARFASANPTATASEVSAVAEAMGAVLGNAAAVTYTVTNEAGATARIRHTTVRADLNHQLLMPGMRDADGILPPALLTLNATAKMPVIQ